MRTRIKICGITRPVDAKAATDAGVDAIGLIFFPPSPRAVDTGVASEIAEEIPAFTTVVGVFVNSSSQVIEDVLAKVRVNCLQFHGDEAPQECERYGIPYIKTVRMKDSASPREVAESHKAASAILLDSYDREKYGGTGETFSWQRAKGCCEKPVILAGGLNPSNAAEAIMVSDAYGIDISSGVEIAPGIKDSEKIGNLVAVVREFNRAVRVTIGRGEGIS